MSVIEVPSNHGRASRRRGLEVAGDRESTALAANLGREVLLGRRAMGLTQAALAARVGIHQSWLGEIERGGGVGVPLGLWVALGLAIGRPLSVAFSRGADASTRDAGHLAIQELVLRLARMHGLHRGFELATRSLRSIDVGLRDERRRILSLIEIWNTIDDVGAAKRDTNRKLDELRQFAAAQDRPYRVRMCWVIRATAANRALVARYPSVFEAAFPGSSRAWARALVHGEEPPEQPGIVWADVAGTRLYEWRRR